MFLVRWLVQCAKCKAEQTLITFRDRRDFVPTLPSGWTEGDRGSFYCPRHVVTVSITVTVDGVTVTQATPPIVPGPQVVPDR